MYNIQYIHQSQISFPILKFIEMLSRYMFRSFDHHLACLNNKTVPLIVTKLLAQEDA
jgi:hypothetical protein